MNHKSQCKIKLFLTPRVLIYHRQILRCKSFLSETEDTEILLNLTAQQSIHGHLMSNFYSCQSCLLYITDKRTSVDWIKNLLNTSCGPEINTAQAIHKPRDSFWLACTATLFGYWSQKISPGGGKQILMLSYTINLRCLRAQRVE